MLWSEIAVDVTELESTLAPNTTEVQTFTIINDGPGELEYNISFDFPAEVSVRTVSRIPVVQNQRTAPNVIEKIRTGKMIDKEDDGFDLTGLAPRDFFDFSNKQRIEQSNPLRDPDYQAYAYNAYDASGANPEGPVTFVLDTPSGLTSLAATTSSDFIAAATMVEDLWIGCEYGTGTFYTMDFDGTMTYIGGNGTACNGLAYDDNAGILYGATYGATSDLYIIDPANGNGTFVGTINSGIIIAMACDSDGNLYGTDITDDNLYSIDPATGFGTVIGPLGIDISYAQGAEYDKDGDVLYLSAYTASGELHTCDTSTGATTYIGAFPGGMEVTGLAIPYSRETWVQATDNASGTVPGNGGSIIVEITFDATELAVGDVLTADLLIQNNANYSADGDDYVIPVTLVVADLGTEGDLPVLRTSLNENYPNPFNPDTNIAYAIKEAGDVKLEVYNIRGQLVKTLVNEERETGHYIVNWNGRDNSNKSVASGVYFYKMKANKFVETKKMILMK